MRMTGLNALPNMMAQMKKRDVKKQSKAEVKAEVLPKKSALAVNKRPKLDPAQEVKMASASN